MCKVIIYIGNQRMMEELKKILVKRGQKENLEFWKKREIERFNKRK